MNELPGIPAVQPGDLVGGKFRLGRILGRGGTSIVYEARHVQLGQDLALKVLATRPDARRGAFERALLEAQASARLTSEHVVRVLDVGTTDAGQAYVVMERLNGVDLGQELRNGQPAAVPDAVEIILQACHGLAEAHGFGIVHRDIKPSNLFLARRPDKSVVVKLLDFGLARADSLTAPPGQLSTAPRIAGSPGYASPEQLGTASDVDARADIWGLGIVLYELVTGRRPFEAVNLTDALIAAATVAVPPMQTPRGPVSPDLERIVRRCLEKDRENRFASVVDLADALLPHAPPSFAHYPDRIREIAGRAHSAPSQSRITLPDGPISVLSAGTSSEREPHTHTGVENEHALMVSAVLPRHRIGLGITIGALAVGALLFVAGARLRQPAQPAESPTVAAVLTSTTPATGPSSSALGPLAPLPPLTAGATSSRAGSAEGLAAGESSDAGEAVRRLDVPPPARSAAVRGTARAGVAKPGGSGKTPASNPMTYR